MRDASGRGFASILYRLRGPQDVFRVEYEDGAGRHARDLPGVPASARPQSAPEGPSLPTLEWLDDNTAYLAVPTFSNRRIRAAGTTFADAIHAIFQDLEQRGARDLILDLRENGGGSEPNKAVLFSYLVERPLHRYAKVEARGQHISVRSLSGRTFETDVFEAEGLPRQRRLWNRRLTRRNAPPLGLMSRWTPSSPVFKGRLVVLAGGSTLSGGAELASILYHVRRGVSSARRSAAPMRAIRAAIAGISNCRTATWTSRSRCCCFG
ncbi:S41 family peptidase [Brevundimonas sp. G8]|uniref:S41 family peptidase n=1 Tax=Brevundimonas sp. G8 TaxID=1350776 RepID=UPI0013570F3D|nr:S41 family peptidase [Brevundimonas sp. G8]